MLLRAPEPGERNIGVFVTEHADALAESLGTAAAKLVKLGTLPDELIAPGLHARLEELRRGERVREVRRAAVAAEQLARTTRWLDDRAVLDVDLLLGELLADRSKKYLRFVADTFDVAVHRITIAQCKPLRRTFMDVASFVDEKRLGLRWRGGRGSLNFYPQEIDAPERALVVALPARRPARHAWQAIGEALRRDGYLT